MPGDGLRPFGCAPARASPRGRATERTWGVTRLGAGRSASSAASPLRVGSARRLGIPPQRCVCHRTRATGAPGLRCGHYGRYKGLGVAPSCRPPRPIPAAGAFARVLSAYPSIDSWADDASAYYPRCDNRMAQQGQIRSLRRVQGLPLGAGATRIPGTGWSCGLPAGRRPGPVRRRVVPLQPGSCPFG